MIESVLITGVPGSGKTTIAKTLASELPRAAYISGDMLREQIMGGYVNPAEEWTDETRAQYYLSFRNEASLVVNYSYDHFVSIIDDVVHGGDLFLKWKNNFEYLSYKVVLLHPTLDEALKRNKKRKKNINEDVVRRLYNDFSANTPADWTVIDNTELTVADTVDVIKQRFLI